jgi:hypothetical protein
MPVYNSEAFLSEALVSIQQQTFVDWELVAVDDGSQDTSGSVLETFAAADRRIRILANKTNTGVSAALNRGWREARGAYIARLDADDVALPQRLARQVEFLDAHPSVAVVGGAAIFIDGAGRRLSIARVPSSNRAIKATLPRHNCFNHPSVMLRRAALVAVGGYRFDHVEDYDLWLRLSERFDLANLPEPLILYRVHADQVSLRALEEQVRRAVAVRAAARIRRSLGVDPLGGVADLTPEIAAQLCPDGPEFAAALEPELLAWATTLAELGRNEQAAELVGRASRTLGKRAQTGFAAARELRHAERSWGSRRRVDGLAHVLRAVRYDRSFTSSRLRVWLSDRLRDLHSG